MPVLSGVVCCRVDDDVDKNKRLQVMKKKLAAAIPDAAPGQVGSQTKPETTYANPDGWLFLQDMRSRMDDLEKKASRDRRKVLSLEEEASRDRRKVLSLKEELNETVLLLQPLKSVAAGIRERFFATFSRDADPELKAIGNESAIETGNAIAHKGDIVTDIHLFGAGLIHYNGAFKKLYGLDWEEAKEWIDLPFLVEVMNHRATTVVANVEREKREKREKSKKHEKSGKHEDRWSKEREFRELLDWAKRANDDDLKAFNEDQTGGTHKKRLYFDIIHSKD